jgi:sugar lactone lactonase YvrE
MRCKMVWAGLTALAAAGHCALAETSGAASHVVGNVDATVVVDGLSTPEAIAFHPATGDVYVVEKTPGRVTRVRAGKAETVVQKGFTVIDDLPPWALSSKFPLPYWMNAVLRNPEGLAFGADGRMYVTEDVPGGRLFEFKPEPDGSYQQARVIPIPWMEAAYSWDAVCVGADGRLFLAGSTTEMGPGMYYGAILMRDPGGDWWMVDYGPFAKFSSVSLSADGQVLMTSEQVSGQVNWWDVARHSELGGTMEQLPNLHGVAPLPDGSILAVQESGLKMSDKLKGHDPRALPGRIVRIDPLMETVAPVIDGLNSPKSILASPDGTRILVAENASGSILELRPRTPMHGAGKLMDLAMNARYIHEGRAPKRWPGFLKTFMSEVGVKAVDEAPGALEAEVEMRADSGRHESGFTLEEFADRIPLVAGRIMLEETVPGTSDDPLREIRFIFLYPNQMIRTADSVTPSMCLFTATHASGRRERTRVLDGLIESLTRLGGQGAGATGHGARLFIPMASCNAQSFRRGTQLTLAFMGIDMLDDYYLTVADGRSTSGTLVRQKMRNGGAEHYKVSFVETDAEGNQENNLVIAGLSRNYSEEFGWYKIGRSPTPKLLSMRSVQDAPFVTRRTRELIRLYEQNELNWRLAQGGEEPLPATELAATTTPSTGRPGTFVPATVRNGEYVAPVARKAGVRPSIDSSRETLRATGPRDERRAERPAEEREATKPADERRAEKPSDGGTAKKDGDKPLEDMVFSKAVEAWQKQN